MDSLTCEQEGTSAAGTVRGMVLVGISLRQEERDGIDREVRNGHVLADYVVVADGGKPADKELAVSIFIVVSAVLVGSLLLRNWVRRRRRGQVLPPPSPQMRPEGGRV